MCLEPIRQGKEAEKWLQVQVLYLRYVQQQEDEEAFEVFAVYCGLALHHAKLYDKIRRSEQKYKVRMPFTISILFSVTSFGNILKVFGSFCEFI